MLIDLQTHSCYSDGSDNPRDILRMAEEKSIRAVSITDHDAVAAYDNLDYDGTVHLVPGVEVNCSNRSFGELHILGYYIDPKNPRLRSFLSNIQHSRLERVRKTLFLLKREEGLDVSFQEFRTMFPGVESFCSLHMAVYLRKRKYCRSTAEAFQNFLRPGRPGFVPRDDVSIAETIGVIEEAGGIPFLAHPLRTRHLDIALKVLSEQGIKGMECFYRGYSSDQCGELAVRARRYGLFISGGTDFHGEMTGFPLEGIQVGYHFLREWLKKDILLAAG